MNSAISVSKCNHLGFALVELLVVVSIIGILVTIAIPAYLGQREKAKVKAVVASAKGVVSEIQSFLDSFVAAEPFIALNSSGTESCYEVVSAPLSKSCQRIFPDVATRYTYPADDIDNLITIILTQYEAKGKRSPYNGDANLFSSVSGRGVVVLSATGTNTINIQAYGSDASTPIFSTFVTSH